MPAFPRRFSLISLFGLLLCSQLVSADTIRQTKGDFEDKFRQLDEALPTPNVYRNAAGEPGQQYWQQQVNYKMDVVLDEA
jgi:predicted secreted protein